MDLFTGRITVNKPIYQWDRQVSGFGVRLNKDGSRVYVAKLSLNGRAHWYTLGPVDLVRAEDARRLVQRMKLLAKAGDDPGALLLAFQRSENLNPAAGVTFSDFVQIYVDRYARVHKRSWLKDKQRLDFYCLPAWGSRRLADISRLDVAELHSKIGRTRVYAANRLIETLTTLFKQAIVLGFLPDSHPMPTYGIKHFREQPRKERIDLHDFPALAAAIHSYPKKIYRYAIYLALYTGLRHGELIRLRWEYFDYKRNTITIPRTKNGEPHTLPLSPSIIKLLDDLPRSSPWVFPSPLTGRHIASLSKAWQKIRKDAGFPALRLHDLRRSFGCLLLKQTNSMPVVRDALNHSNEHITSVYAFYSKQDLEPILNEHARTIDRALGLDAASGENQ